MYVTIYEEYGKGYRYCHEVASVYFADMWIRCTQKALGKYSKFATIVALSPYTKPVIPAEIMEHFPGQTYPTDFHITGIKRNR